MPRINEYPETQSLSNDDKFLIDPGDGEYKSIKASDLAYNVQASALGPIYNACVAAGVVPASIHLPDLITAIGLIGHGKTFEGEFHGIDANGLVFNSEWLVNNIATIARNNRGSGTLSLGYRTGLPPNTVWNSLGTISKNESITIDASWKNLSSTLILAPQDMTSEVWCGLIFTFK